LKPHILVEDSDAKAVPKRIALIRREAPARLLDHGDEFVPSAPHLLMQEIIVLQACIVLLAIVSLLFDAPLEGIADPYHTPNPAKAPWYFLGLQELLHYFPPVVAGVLLPFLAVVGVAVVPYFRMNVEVSGFYERPWKRPLALLTILTAGISALLVVYHVWPVLIPTVVVYVLVVLPALAFCPAGLSRRLSAIPMSDWIMSWFVAVVTILTAIGVFFRGPGWSWIWPWKDGIY